jgi:hypothetical protein
LVQLHEFALFPEVVSLNSYSKLLEGKIVSDLFGRFRRICGMKLLANSQKMLNKIVHLAKYAE